MTASSAHTDRADPVPQYDAVTFDFWDTLVRADRAATRVQQRLAIVDVLASHDLTVEHDDIDAAFDEAWRRFDQSWGTGRQFTGRDAAETVLDLLGHTDRTVRDGVIDAYLTAPRSMRLDLTDNLVPTLRVLRDAGVRIGIVCDVGLTPSPVLRGYLEDHGILDLFDHWSFSDEVGVYKPQREIFEHALAGLGGIDPTRAAHIGDLRRTDVAGSRAMGMLALRYRGVTDDDPANGPEGDVVIDDHAQLPDMLGL